MPHIVPNFIALGQTINKKSVTKRFLHPSVFGVPGRPPGQRSPMYSMALTTNVLNFVPV